MHLSVLMNVALGRLVRNCIHDFYFGTSGIVPLYRLKSHLLKKSRLLQLSLLVSMDYRDDLCIVAAAGVRRELAPIIAVLLDF